MTALASALPDRALTLVIGALGGEGGGVLTTWIVNAAERMGYPVQSTSIPGVAQRTGATTYYIEIFPATHEQLGGRTPVMAMYATPVNMDLVVVSEIMEAGRMLENGMVTPDRTTLIASTHRVYSILEKSAMSGGLYDSTRIVAAVQEMAQRTILFDMDKVAEDSKSAINAVILGTIAGSERLPIPASVFEDAIKSAGVAVSSNLAGFRAGLACVRGEIAPPEPVAATRPAAAPATVRDLLDEVAAFPAEARHLIAEGVKRLADYQDTAYARDYLDRLRPVLELDRKAGGAARGFAVTAETARYLALMMSYEDIIRVAQLKSRPERMERVRQEVRAAAHEPVNVTEFLKPGWEEISSIMPPAMGRAVMAWAGRSPRRNNFHFAMRVNTASFTGYLRLWILARLRWWRPRTFRFHEEMADIVRWLEAISKTLPRSYDLALEIIECANLRKGYSDTHRRGLGNFNRVFEALIAPAARGERDPGESAAAIRRARDAAFADPEGKTLEAALSAPNPERPGTSAIAAE